MTELATIPGASPQLNEAIALIYMFIRNKVTVNGSTATIHNDAGTAVFDATVSDNGTTFTKAEYTDS